MDLLVMKFKEKFLIINLYQIRKNFLEQYKNGIYN